MTVVKYAGQSLQILGTLYVLCYDANKYVFVLVI